MSEILYHTRSASPAKLDEVLAEEGSMGYQLIAMVDVSAGRQDAAPQFKLVFSKVALP